MRDRVGDHNDKSSRENGGLLLEEEGAAVFEKFFHLCYYTVDMPITAGAIRKLRADKRKTVMNGRVRRGYKKAVSDTRKKATAANLTKAFSQLDRAAKKGTIHKNKANRLKSRLAKLMQAKKKK